MLRVATHGTANCRRKERTVPTFFAAALGIALVAALVIVIGSFSLLARAVEFVCRHWC